jgi:hypothetical protein
LVPTEPITIGVPLAAPGVGPAAPPPGAAVEPGAGAVPALGVAPGLAAAAPVVAFPEAAATPPAGVAADVELLAADPVAAPAEGAPDPVPVASEPDPVEVSDGAAPRSLARDSSKPEETPGRTPLVFDRAAAVWPSCAETISALSRRVPQAVPTATSTAMAKPTKARAVRRFMEILLLRAVEPYEH